MLGTGELLPTEACWLITLCTMTWPRCVAKYLTPRCFVPCST